MSRHFNPRKARDAQRKYNEILPTQPPKPKPLYEIYWWFKTKPYEKTNQFFISFKIPMNRDIVHVELSKAFPCKVDVFASGFWYAIELNERVSWREVKEYTGKALEGLL